MSYKDDLKDVRWQQKRLKILERDKWKCQKTNCSTPEYLLQVHHLDYFPGIKPWDYPDDMLLTLCDNCHGKENGRTELERNLASTLKMKGFLVSDLLALSCKLDTDKHFTETLLKILREMQNG